MKEKKRSETRSYLEREKARAYRNAKQMFGSSPRVTEADIKKNACSRYNNQKVCSCSGCGNPRKWNKGKSKLTMQEIRAKMD